MIKEEGGGGGGGGGGGTSVPEGAGNIDPHAYIPIFLGKPIDVGQSEIVLIVLFVSLVKNVSSLTGERKFQRE